MRWLSLPVVALLAALLLPASSLGHSERLSYYPDYREGKVPSYRNKGRSLVVCKRDSRRRIRRIRGSRRLRSVRRLNQRLLKRCKFRHIQAAVDRARNGTRILVLPGVYREEPSRRVPEPDPSCKDDYEEYSEPDPQKTGEVVRVANYEYQRKCPNAQNLIAIIGDGPDADRKCDRKCDIQIEGTGAKPQQVLISGEKSKLNLIRADRADGIHLRNFKLQFSDFNNIYALETNGFRFEKIESAYSREYGFLSFTSDNGLYRDLIAYGSGDSGVYPGSGPEGRCHRYGIEIDRVDSYGNQMGHSGTMANGVWVHDSKFHHNSTGIVVDSFAPGHPGSPQDCSKFENNQIYSNNLNLFDDAHDQYCYERSRPIKDRDPKYVCPSFPLPVGTGMLIAGGNKNVLRNNHFWDNWRYGTYQMWVPAFLRGADHTGQSEGTGNQYDTSNGNRYEGNRMGVRPDGTRDPNGTDFWWDEEGSGNCWVGNTGPGGAPVTGDPSPLPACPGSPILMPGNSVKQSSHATCAVWDPQDPEYWNPPGCSWLTTSASEPR